MNKALRLIVLAAALVLPQLLPAQTQTPPDRELRSAWVATVWRLDWPQTLISNTGNQSQINKQKTQMTTLLDSLAENNFNAINFQVRSRSDAFYRSSYEPWSSDLVEERGMDPGYDPLAFTIEECHKRGIECHAWINPYRYESVKGQWDGTPGAYRDTHPEWLIDVTGSNGTTASILNPGLPEVTELICNIIREIVQNYDVDGVLFDDYFYLSGTNTSHDGALYDAYKAAGGTLSIGDWRRDNVNRMIAAVYSTIKETKPWVRFGVSPAGIACTSNSVANQYGIPRCPTGSDWQYADIYSDPIAWVSNQDLDFISPQIYWTIGNSTDYDKATKWWSMVANKWERHLFVSHSISNLNASSSAPEKQPGMSDTEAAIAAARMQEVLPTAPAIEYASGPNAGSFQEYVNEIMLNREYNLDNAPGSIFYSAKYLYRIAPLFAHYLRRKAFTTMCLPPSMPWLAAPVPEAVENLSLSGSKLSWTAQPNMRYTVYRYPATFTESEMLRQPEYLAAVTYVPEYTIDEKHLYGFRFAVAAYDRYGNESTLALPGQPVGQLEAPALTGEAAAGQTVEAPFNFSWTPVDKAGEYVVEIAYDAEMNRRVDQRSTTETSISSSRFLPLPLDVPLYWRVRACSTGYKDGISAPLEFSVSQLRILTPASGETTASLTPTFTYSMEGREVNLEISTTEDFEDDDIIYRHTHTGNHTVAEYTLAGATHYYARARYSRNGEQLICPAVEFTTPEVAPSVPSIAFPTAGGDFHSDSHITLAPIAGPSALRVEVSASESFPVRNSYIQNKVNTATRIDPRAGSDIRILGKSLQDGQTYYCRARATFTLADGSTVNTAYSAGVPFVYRSAESGVSDVEVAGAAVSVEGSAVRALTDLTGIAVHNAAGLRMAFPESLAAGQSAALDAAPGVYFLTANGKTVKIIVE